MRSLEPGCAGATRQAGQVVPGLRRAEAAAAQQCLHGAGLVVAVLQQRRETRLLGPHTLANHRWHPVPVKPLNQRGPLRGDAGAGQGGTFGAATGRAGSVERGSFDEDVRAAAIG